MLIAIIPDIPALSYIDDILKIADNKGAKILLILSNLSRAHRKYADFILDFEGTNTGVDQYIFDMYIAILNPSVDRFCY
jgi:hypothetical protein